MKNFFRRINFFEVILLSLLILVYFLGILIVGFKFSPVPIFIGLGTWVLSSMIDSKKYFNVWTMLISLLVTYPVFIIFYI